MHPSAQGHPDFRSEDAVDYRGITAYEDAEGAGQMEVQKCADCRLHEHAYNASTHLLLELLSQYLYIDIFSIPEPANSWILKRGWCMLL